MMSLLTSQKITRRFTEQLSYEFNCIPEAFSSDENTITLSVLDERRRKFSDKPFFLQMATFGHGTVISADEKLHPWLSEWVKGKQGLWLFEQHNYWELECILRKHGYKMSLTHHMFTPKPLLMDVQTDLSLKWMEKAEFEAYYGHPDFPNVLCSSFKSERPDKLTLAAMDGERIMGMAGVSADKDDLWQIGIDVLPEYRGRGVARTLVSLLRNEVFARGAIPYYGTSLSNLGSWKTALSSGFEPAWVQAEALLCDDTLLVSDDSVSIK